MKIESQKIAVMIIAVGLTSCGGGGGKSSPSKTQAQVLGTTTPTLSEISNSSSTSITGVGGGADTNVEYSNARYVTMGKLLLRGNYLSPRDGMPEAPRSKGVNTLFGLDPDYLPVDYVQRDACWDGSGKYCFHTGIDYRAAKGTSVYSPVDGVVSTEPGGDYGKVTILDETSNRYVSLLHLSEINVKNGDQVSVGCKIGLTGDTGVEGQPHLHIEERNSSGLMGWIGTSTGLTDAGAISPLSLLDHYGVNTENGEIGIGLGTTTESCAQQSSKSSSSRSAAKSSVPASSKASSVKSSVAALSAKSSSSSAPKPIQSCTGLNGTTYSVGESEYNVVGCQAGQEGFLSQMRTCASGVEFGNWEAWVTSGNFCTNIPTPPPPLSSITGIDVYNFNSTTKVFEAGVRSYNNIVAVITGSNLAPTTVVDIPGFSCNITASLTSSYLGNIGYATTGAYGYSGAEGTTKVNYPSSSPTTAIVSICLGEKIPVGTTITISAKHKSGESSVKSVSFTAK